MKLRPALDPQQAQTAEAGEFTAVGILVIVWTALSKLRDKPSIILWSSYLLLALWGFHGDMAVLTSVLGEGWAEQVTFGLPWGKQLVSFVVGFVLVVVVPCFIVRLRFKQSLREYGLGLPAKDQRRKAVVAFVWTLGITSILIVVATFDKGMQQTYPLFTQRVGGQVVWTITNWPEFLIYELVYLLFFISIEFAFRGYLLFGLSSSVLQSARRVGDGYAEHLQRFGLYAILIQMLAYTTWHYGKPVPELMGALVWGVFIAAVALRIRSLWPIILSHWLYNVLLDWLLWVGFPSRLGG